MKTRKKQRGGWPAKDRVAIIVRPERKLLDALDKLRGPAISRSALIERWLSAMVDALKFSEKLRAEQLAPEQAIDFVGLQLVRALGGAGVLADFLRDGLEQRDREDRRRLTMAEKGARE